MAAKYTSKIIKAQALLDDTKIFFNYWDDGLGIEKNLIRAKEENILAKPSRSRVQDILHIFRQRYLFDLHIASALSLLVKKSFPNEWLNLIFYLYSTRADKLIYDTVTKILLPEYNSGQRDIAPEDLMRSIKDMAKEGKEEIKWGETTFLRIVQGLLTALRDFGLLEGSAKKRLAPLYIPVEVFSFIAFDIAVKNISGKQMINHKDWKLFFLSDHVVERFFLEAHQEKLLEYYAAGSVIRINFPAGTLKEYAHVIIERET